MIKTKDSAKRVPLHRFGGTLGHTFHKLYSPKGDKNEGVIGIAGPYPRNGGVIQDERWEYV